MNMYLYSYKEPRALRQDEDRIPASSIGRVDCKADTEELVLLRTRERKFLQFEKELDLKANKLRVWERSLHKRELLLSNLQTELESKTFQFQERDRYLRALQKDLETSETEFRKHQRKVHEREKRASEKEEKLNVGDDYNASMRHSQMLEAQRTQQRIDAHLSNLQQRLAVSESQRIFLEDELHVNRKELSSLGQRKVSVQTELERVQSHMHTMTEAWKTMHARLKQSEERFAASENQRRSLEKELQECRKASKARIQREDMLQTELERAESDVQMLLDKERHLALVETIRQADVSYSFKFRCLRARTNTVQQRQRMSETESKRKGVEVEVEVEAVNYNGLI